MLNHLHISNFAIVPTLDLDFRQGFTAITGETGAGKSILVDALGLLLGSRSDAEWVRPGAARAELTAEFSLQNNRQARKWLEQTELADGSCCLLRRTITAGGRSRAFINGTPVTVGQLQTLGQMLVEIHGQNEFLRLTKSAQQLLLLDDSGDYQDKLVAVRSIYAQWKSVGEQLKALDRELPTSSNDLDFLKFQLTELAQHDVSKRSIDKLQKEHDRLAAGEALLMALNTGIGQLEPDSPNGDTGVNSRLNTMLTQLQSFTHLDDDISNACQMLTEAAVNCDEALTTLRAARESADLDPLRFESVANRLSQIHELARKHGVNMDELDGVIQNLKQRIQLASSTRQRRMQLEQELTAHLEQYRVVSSNLGRLRIAQAAILSTGVTQLMAELGMKGGVFELLVSPDPTRPPATSGDDVIQINISATPGMPPGPLNKIASGGELSRISLAIKVASSDRNTAVTQIFDEVDAGIGGDTANSVGRLLNRLSEHGQVLCVTHLAQVAVCADHQLQVIKASSRVAARVDTRVLDEKDRVDEIARMLSGRLSEQSRAHAQELLSAANATD